jgi:phosphomannomutase
VIEQLQAFVETQPDWAIVPKNYEGVRVACSSPDEDGWFLLRLSLHDPVLPLNIESQVAGGVVKIAQRLRAFLAPLAGLDISALDCAS